MKKIALFTISFYKKLVSPLLVSIFGHSCRFLPTCSEYTYDAVKKYGVLKGSALGLKRISRCHGGTPFSFDPLK